MLLVVVSESLKFGRTPPPILALNASLRTLFKLLIVRREKRRRSHFFDTNGWDNFIIESLVFSVYWRFINNCENTKVSIMEIVLPPFWFVLPPFCHITVLNPRLKFDLQKGCY